MLEMVNIRIVSGMAACRDKPILGQLFEGKRFVRGNLLAERTEHELPLEH